MFLWFLIVLLWTTEVRLAPSSASLGSLVDEKPTVHAPDLGRFQGTTTRSAFTNKEIYKFTGINYAAPPSGANRFNPPQPFEWNSSMTTYDATLMRQPCPQIDLRYYPKLPPHLVDAKPDTEDCLVVNVYTPKIPRPDDRSLLPVLFFIHGGSFYAGSAQDFGPEFLLEKDILLVVPQYRLGVLGFTSLQTDSIAGNAGVLDILLALEWVKNNIRWFGGDPDQVTVAGQSAGAAIASALLLSPLMKPGLFKQLIVQSGSIDAPWSVSNDMPKELKGIAKNAHCFSDDLQEIADCLRKTPVNDLVNAHITYMDKLDIGESSKPTALTVQTAGTHRFLVKHPQWSLQHNEFLKMPVMAGTTRDDGSAFMAELFHEIPLDTEWNWNMTRRIVKVVTFQQPVSTVVDFYHNKYLSKVKNFREALRPLYDLFGAFMMKGPTVSFARYMRRYSPSYIYSFDFKGNVSKLATSEPTWNNIYPIPIGVAHSDELGYLFPMTSHNYSQKELQMVEKMVRLWTDFVIYGNPTQNSDVKWEPMDNDFGPYFRISDDCTLEDNIFKEYEVTGRHGFITETSSAAKLENVVSFFTIASIHYILIL